MDPESRKISLSLKHLQADPWLKVQETYAIGKAATGRVTRLAEFGAFVELEPGIEALAHVSTFPPTKGGWKSLVKVGEQGRFRIESVEPDRRRIGVALMDVATDPKPAPPAPDTRPGRKAPRPESRKPDPPKAEGFGLLADKLRSAMKRGGKDG